MLTDLFYLQREWCLFLEMLTHNMLSQKGSVVCRPFWICCYNSGQASGVMEPKWRWLFPPGCQQCGVSVRRQAVDGEESVYNVLVKAERWGYRSNL